MVAALNKYWRQLSVDEYLKKMDIPATNNAIVVSGFPEEVANWIWVEDQKVGAHFKKVSRSV